MKNIHVLKTDKPSRLHFDDKLFLSTNYQLSKTINSIVENRNIYITNSEEIKEGDWVISKEGILHNNFGWNFGDKKIILTTYPDLIKDGVQAIDDEFLEWFVKNPSCEWVEVKRECCGKCDERLCEVYDTQVGWTKENTFYKIIIPKEEPKTQGYICPQTKSQCDDECCVSAEDCHIKASIGVLSDTKQETLEEAKYNAYKEYWNENHTQEVKSNFLTAFKLGAKWQQERMYSEEEVIELLEKRDKYLGNWLPPKKWLEQFKKQIR